MKLFVERLRNLSDVREEICVGNSPVRLVQARLSIWSLSSDEISGGSVPKSGKKERFNETTRKASLHKTPVKLQCALFVCQF